MKVNSEYPSGKVDVEDAKPRSTGVADVASGCCAAIRYVCQAALQCFVNMWCSPTLSLEERHAEFLWSAGSPPQEGCPLLVRVAKRVEESLALLLIPPPMTLEEALHTEALDPTVRASAFELVEGAEIPLAWAIERETDAIWQAWTRSVIPALAYQAYCSCRTQLFRGSAAMPSSVSSAAMLPPSEGFLQRVSLSLRACVHGAGILGRLPPLLEKVLRAGRSPYLALSPPTGVDCRSTEELKESIHRQVEILTDNLVLRYTMQGMLCRLTPSTPREEIREAVIEIILQAKQTSAAEGGNIAEACDALFNEYLAGIDSRGVRCTHLVATAVLPEIRASIRSHLSQVSQQVETALLAVQSEAGAQEALRLFSTGIQVASRRFEKHVRQLESRGRTTASTPCLKQLEPDIDHLQRQVGDLIDRIAESPLSRRTPCNLLTMRMYWWMPIPKGLHGGIRKLCMMLRLLQPLLAAALLPLTLLIQLCALPFLRRRLIAQIKERPLLKEHCARILPSRGTPCLEGSQQQVQEESFSPNQLRFRVRRIKQLSKFCNRVACAAHRQLEQLRMLHAPAAGCTAELRAEEVRRLRARAGEPLGAPVVLEQNFQRLIQASLKIFYSADHMAGEPLPDTSYGLRQGSGSDPILIDAELEAHLRAMDPELSPARLLEKALLSKSSTVLTLVSQGLMDRPELRLQAIDTALRHVNSLYVPGESGRTQEELESAQEELTCAYREMEQHVAELISYWVLESEEPMIRSDLSGHIALLEEWAARTEHTKARKEYEQHSLQELMASIQQVKALESWQDTVRRAKESRGEASYLLDQLDRLYCDLLSEPHGLYLLQRMGNGPDQEWCTQSQRCKAQIRDLRKGWDTLQTDFPPAGGRSLTRFPMLDSMLKNMKMWLSVNPVSANQAELYPTILIRGLVQLGLERIRGPLTQIACDPEFGIVQSLAGIETLLEWGRHLPWDRIGQPSSGDTAVCSETSPC